MKNFQIKCGEINGFFEGRSIGTTFRAILKEFPKLKIGELCQFREMSPNGRIITKARSKYYWINARSLLNPNQFKINNIKKEIIQKVVKIQIKEKIDIEKWLKIAEKNQQKIKIIPLGRFKSNNNENNFLTYFK